MLISHLLKNLLLKNHHTSLWTSWGQCSSLVITERPSLTHHLRIAALCAAYGCLWQEKLMEHICIVEWFHHRIVWPSQGYVWRAVMFLISQQEQDDTLARGIQTIPSRLSCTIMFCQLWRLVKSRNLLVAMSLPVSAVCTSISARPFYTRVSEPVVAYALGSAYLLCARSRGWSTYQSCLGSPAPSFAKGWQRALVFTSMRQSVEELSCQPGPVSCLVRLPTGLNICELVWTHKRAFEASNFVHQGQYRQHNFGETCGVGNCRFWLLILTYFLWQSCPG